MLIFNNSSESLEIFHFDFLLESATLVEVIRKSGLSNSQLAETALFDVKRSLESVDELLSVIRQLWTVSIRQSLIEIDNLDKILHS